MIFPLRDLLTVTTGRLLTKPKGPKDNGIDSLYKLLAYMAGEAPFTHQLGRFGEECKPWLLRWFPELANANTDSLDEFLKVECPEKAVETWLASCVSGGMSDSYDVLIMPAVDHKRIDPIEELADNFPGEIVVVKTPEGGA